MVHERPGRRGPLAAPRAALLRAGQTLAGDVPRVAGGLLAEAGWTASHLLRYPLGLRPVAAPSATSGVSHLSAQQRGLVETDVDAAGTPILLVHGIVDNHTIFSSLERELRRRGFSTLTSHDYSLLTRDVRRAAEAFGVAVQAVARHTGYERIHVVGHSLGGLIARYHVQRQGGDALVDTLVTLGSPHRGTLLARLGPPVPLVRQLRPGSELMVELAAPAPGCRTRFVAFASDIDHLVLPSGAARLEHPDLDVRNVEVRGVGHMSLTNHRGIALQIAREFGAAVGEPDSARQAG